MTKGKRLAVLLRELAKSDLEALAATVEADAMDRTSAAALSCAELAALSGLCNLVGFNADVVNGMLLAACDKLAERHQELDS